MDIEAILAKLAEIKNLSADELASIRAELLAASDELLDVDTDAALADLEKIATALGAIKAEETTRAEEAAARKAKAAELAEAIKAATAGDDPEDDGDPAEGDADAEGAADAEDKTPVAVAAAAGKPEPKVTRVAARRPETTKPKVAATSGWNLTASANAPKFTAGTKLTDAEHVAQAFTSAAEATGQHRGPNTLKVSVAFAGGDPDGQFGDERTLSRDARGNERKIHALTALPALTASGGICAQTPVRYDMPTLGSDARPVRDELCTRFGADRGGVTLYPIMTLTDVEDGVGVWTHTTDVTPGQNVKDYMTVECPSESEYIVDAITKSVVYGEFRRRFFPEQITEVMNLLGVQHARFAERRMITAIGAASKQITTGELLGAARDALAALDRATAIFRNTHRLPDNFPFRWGAPVWLKNMIRTDLARELPGSSSERLAVADATIASFLSVRNINVSWIADGETGQDWGVQGNGALQGWPDSVVSYLFPEGSWLFLDGGVLDLGIIRDSTLASTNDVKFFAETFEQVAFHGVDSWRLSMDLCPSGKTSATEDIDPCSSGS